MSKILKVAALLALALSLGSFPATASADEHPGDTTPPTLALPGDLFAQAWDPAGEFVWYWVDAWDDVDGWLPADCSPPPGMFPLGTTTVQCTATDSSGNVATGSFNVTVVGDTTPPTLSLPGDMVVNAQSPAGAMIWYWAEAWDDLSGWLPANCVPPPGAVFPIGTTTVECTATDFFGNVAAGSFTVTVLADETPPELSLPGPFTVEADDDAGAVVWYWAGAWDNVDGWVPVTCTPDAGTLFPLGTTTVECTASDSWGNVARGSFDVTVRGPLVITVAVTGGSVNTVTGLATITGTLECSQNGAAPAQPTSVRLSGTATQRVGRVLIRGQLGAQLACSTPASSWSVETTDSTGLFVAGSATVSVTVSRFGWPPRSASAQETVRLKPAR